MILILKPNTQPDEVAPIEAFLTSNGIIVQDIVGESTHMIGMAGDTTGISEDKLLRFNCVERIVHVQEPYKLAGRKFRPADSAVNIAGRTIGAGGFEVIAGPCSVENQEQIVSIAKDVKASGAGLLRGGAFKPRTSPYAFQGLGLDGLNLLKIAREQTGLPIVTEIMSQEYIDVFARDVDVIQVGARNMQNFTLLRLVGEMRKPVLLKRGLSSTLVELLMAAEYVMSGGCTQVILCERGIRTFETATRNTLDLSAIPVLKSRSHLPVVIDPSHATGYWQLVAPMSLAAVAAGCDGLIIEVHNHPEKALCDGAQSITPGQFSELMDKIKRIRDIVRPTVST
ncbi:MAG: 3-deoxy-7-phosphoheptulonate synthase [Oscillospiraceae bacterium]|jgi:3-deoxy-7-phosphoheptulonate synthase|nr:3-deoxy-7-phosphoheptulonate synthase [Oscillospiraceae bacterium]